MQEIELRDAPTDSISCVDFDTRTSSDKSMLVASSWDASVGVYDVQSNRKVKEYSQLGAVLGCCFAGVNQVAAGGLEKTVNVYDLETDTEHILGTHTLPIKTVNYSNSHNAVISGSWDGFVSIWDARMKSSLVGSMNNEERVYAVAVAVNYVVASTAAKKVLIWDLRSIKTAVQKRESSLKSQTRALACDPTNTMYAISSIDGRTSIQHFNPSIEHQAKNFAFKCHRNKELDGIEKLFSVNTIAFHPTHATFATGGSDGVVNTWDTIKRRRITKLGGFTNGVSSLAFNHDGSLLAIADSYTFEEGDKGKQIDRIVIRKVKPEEVKGATY